MSKPKISRAMFSFSDCDGHGGGQRRMVTFSYIPGHHSILVEVGSLAVTVDNSRGEYKACVTHALRLIEQVARGDSPVYRGRKRASRAAKPESEVGAKLKQAFKIFGVGDE